MSELIEHNKKDSTSLLEFARGLITGQNVPELIKQYSKEIDSVTPFQTMEILDSLIREGFAVPEVKANVGKILNVFFRSLNGYEWEKPVSDHFLSLMMLENREVEKRMRQLKELTKLFFKGKEGNKIEILLSMKKIIIELKEYDLHYLKKENILFPYIEKTYPAHRCLKIMWSFHDDFRQSLKELESYLAQASPVNDKLNKAIGKLFFTVLPLIFREEQILFPVAYRTISQSGWDDMLNQSHETGWCYIASPGNVKTFVRQEDFPSGFTDLGSGSLTVSQIILMLNNLPVDITFVDANDEVRYFSDVRHKIFGRSRAVIGRKVQNCHPHESVDTVNKILKAFREGSKDHADFWITINDRFIYIRYFALYDINRVYKGTIEVTQDVTEIRSLKGDRRLLQWKE